MKTLVTLLLVGLLSCINAQPIAHESISSIRVNTGMNSNGNLFYDSNYEEAGFKVNYENDFQEGIGTIFSASIWMSGIDLEGNIRATFPFYTNSETGYVPGPTEAPFIDMNFNTIWKVRGEDILNHQDDFEDGEINFLSDAIERWPGTGNPYYGIYLVNIQLAPFHDENGDGIYNPWDGDYPTLGEGLEDVLPLEMIYSVAHDGNENIQDPIGMEIHTLLYSIQCEHDPLLDGTIFSRHMILNKDSDLTDVHVSFWTDPDLGCYSDDYIGSSPQDNSFFTYNRDAIDGEDPEGNCYFEIPTFFDNPPVQGHKFLNQEMTSFLAIQNANSDLPPSMFLPETTMEANYLMDGFWRDGTPLTHGGRGFNFLSTDTVQFVYPDDPNDINGWSQYTSNGGFSLDMHLANTSKSTLAKGEWYTLDMAHHYTQNADLNNVTTVIQHLEELNFVQNIYDTDFEICGKFNTSSKEIEYKAFKISPNPASSEILIETERTFDSYSIYNELGQLVHEGESGKKLIYLSDVVNSGMYVLQLKEGEKIVGVERFVVE